MNNFSRSLLAVLAVATLPALGQDILKPKDTLIVDGLPAIPLDVAKKITAYSEVKPSLLLGWHPIRREMLVRQRLTNTNQVHRVAEPGAKPEPLTDFPDAVNGATYQPTTGDYFLFPRGTGGNEVFRGYRFDLATKAVTPITPDGERSGGFAWSPKGDRVVFTTQPVDKTSTDRIARTTVYTVDPLKPESQRVLARLEGGGWFGWRFSEDGRALAFIEYKSANESYVWIMDVATGKRRMVTKPQKDTQVWYGTLRWSKDNKGLYVLTDRGNEFKQLAYITLATGKEVALTKHVFDIDDYEVSFDANRIAYVTNERGSHVLRFFDMAARKELTRPPLFDGVITDLSWRRKSEEVGFTVTSARSSGDVFSYDLKANKVTRWTNGNNPALNTSEFSEPRLVKWKSFDNLEISGFHYPPPAKFTGKRPVVVQVHGGPEGQTRAGFIGRNNYYLNDLGIALIFPNVRGSTGFGKTFLKLDNGRLREDSVKDLGALIDWIKTQPDLDADKVLVVGGSYGGYMALASSVLLTDRIAGAISTVGISNFVTFLERTETYRRDLRRVEYGDERDPDMRKFLESISPLNRANEIKKPLFVIQGFNDPRVPYTEAEQIVAALKKTGTPVWFLMAKDEGHGFAKRDNADFAFAAQTEFARAMLLK
ncbi:S9 family peptidase [Usitatibacter palustris]|uniref:Dipeptidyl aminopeptidase BIII n=1 Tax=Usitatibacter palustris TaxID=2732487 RepID=A0A6M4H9Z4_9PROT|nr:S9 family peptidase [Usitatibacter palustris]QJR16599.1 Dipeptidyl aminopeptidase BIII [Usitatibacter palustris]